MDALDRNTDASRLGGDIAAVIDRLEKQFPSVPPPDVAAVILEAHEAFQDYPVRTHVPVIVERQARDRLRGRAVDAPHR